MMSITRAGHARTFAALSVGLLLVVSGCSGGSSSDAGGGAAPTPQQVVDKALTTLDDTTGLSITLKTEDLPSGVTGITSAIGQAAHPPAFKGTFSLTVSGFPAEAEVVSVAGKTYAKNSLLLPDWTEIDPATYGAPDPVKLMTPGDGFSKLVSSTSGLVKGTATRGGADNTEILTPYSGTVPADAVTGILPTATGDFDVTLLINADDELRQVKATGVFYDGADPLTYTIGFADYGSTPDITAP